MPLRIIGGADSGRVLKLAPRKGTRPTSDRVREALFAMLESRGADLTRVLDLYSGTGAVGLEALSRGAGEVDFVESDPQACDVIRENLRALGYLGRARVHCLPVARCASRLRGPFTLVVADPPYGYDRAEAELGALTESGLLASRAIIVVEHSKRSEWPDRLGGKERLLSRRYGDTALTVYQ